jgi:hypothetical protein
VWLEDKTTPPFYFRWEIGQALRRIKVDKELAAHEILLDAANGRAPWLAIVPRQKA